MEIIIPLEQAIEILRNARLGMKSHELWMKLYHATDHLEKQIKSELES